MKEYTEVKGKKIWELVKRREEEDDLFCCIRGAYTKASLMSVAAGETLYEIVEHHWYEDLDDTIENSVLCYVWDDHNVNRIQQITAYDKNGTPTFWDTQNTYWLHAKPVEKEALEELYKNTLKALEDE